MHTRNDTVHVTATCDFCWTINQLTISSVPDEQKIHCSTCGGSLGTLGDLKRHQEQFRPARELDRVPA